MILPLPSPHAAKRAVAAFALAISTPASPAELGNFEVREGYLSASVRELVDSHDWSLVWNATEDRVVSHPFTISNHSLQGALESLFSMYDRQFVADLYRGNRVVVVNTPPPGVDVASPGAEVAQQSAVVESSLTEPDFDAESDDQGTTIPLVGGYDATGSDSADRALSPSATSNENERVAIQSP